MKDPSPLEDADSKIHDGFPQAPTAASYLTLARVTVITRNNYIASADLIILPAVHAGVHSYDKLR
jgi:hypothetical protein